MRTLPTVDHVPTMLTGAYPDEHGLWGPKLKAGGRSRGVAQRLVDCLPDFITTSVQGFLHLANGPFDHATMAPKRRRRFEFLRFKYVKHMQLHKVVMPINGKASIFTVVGAERSRYVYQDNHHRLIGLVDRIANGDQTLEMVEAHSLDRLQHWNLNDEDLTASHYSGMDNLVAAMHAKCSQNGTGLLIVSDHGMEPVISLIDLPTKLKSLGVPPDDYDFFIENTRATFWFHDDSARSKIMSRLASIEHATLITREEMVKYNLHFPDNAYGDAYCYAEPGSSFFPNDFHQPLASLTLSLLDWQQRPRLWNPRHRGDHGYVPEHACETGFMLLAEKDFRTPSAPASLIDFAPSVLSLLGREVPSCMKGERAFVHHRDATATR